MKFDMHSHTTDSDGYLNYTELIDYAKEKKLTHLAITNHDSLKNLEEAIIYGKEKGIEIIIGVELSTYLNDESVHVLGYFKDFKDITDLNNYLENVKKEREERTKKMLVNLKKYYDIDIDFSSFNSNNIITRGTMARVISKKYNIKKEDLFLPGGPLSSDSKAFIPSTKLDTYLGIEMLKRHNAFISIAHPTLLKKNNIEDILMNAKASINAIEARYPLNKEKEEKYFKKLCKKYKLYWTAGSDFHFKGDKNHGDVGDCVLKGIYANRIIKKIKKS